jgi:hypothetical protein
MEFKEQRIALETAKLAKEKGYNVHGYGSYTEYLIDQVDPSYPEGGGAFSMTKGEIETSADYFANNWEVTDYTCESYAMYAAPTQALLAKWLREVHNIQVYVNSHTKDGDGKYRDYVAHVNNREINDARDTEFQTYEEAMEVGLKAALSEIIII